MLKHNHIKDNNILFLNKEKTYKKPYSSFELKAKKLITTLQQQKTNKQKNREINKKKNNLLLP